MAGNFIDFMGGIGSTPAPVYGTSAEDVALKQQMAQGANYWNNTRPSQTGYLPSIGGASSTNTGGSVYPWNSPAQMTSPTYGGNGATNPVQTTARGGLNPATDPRLERFVASDGRSISDLLTGVGSYRDPSKPALLPPPTRLGYAATPQNPAVTAATQAGQGAAPPFPRPPIARWNRMDVAEQGPKPGTPAWALYSQKLAQMGLTAPQAGANPGMGGAMVGNGQMSPQIPPQQPPADGSSPLPVWSGGPGQGGPVMRGGTVQRANGTNGYVYGRAAGGPWNQQGKAPWTQGMSPADQYAVANMGGQIAALGRQATATGQTGVHNYVNGVKTGTVNGQSSANAYEAAAARSRDPGTSGEGGNPSWW